MPKFVATFDQGPMAWITAGDIAEAAAQAHGLCDSPVEFDEPAPPRYITVTTDESRHKPRKFQTAAYGRWLERKRDAEARNKQCRTRCKMVKEFTP